MFNLVVSQRFPSSHVFPSHVFPSHLFPCPLPLPTFPLTFSPPTISPPTFQLGVRVARPCRAVVRQGAHQAVAEPGPRGPRGPWGPWGPRGPWGPWGSRPWSPSPGPSPASPAGVQPERPVLRVRRARPLRLRLSPARRHRRQRSTQAHQVGSGRTNVGIFRSNDLIHSFLACSVSRLSSCTT